MPPSLCQKAADFPGACLRLRCLLPVLPLDARQARRFHEILGRASGGRIEDQI
jgi:hypothetical protein